MTKRTTDDWEALLDGTTPGPWGCRWDEGHLAIVGPDEEAIAFDADERDSNLIVAAPEAVAELMRLRRELEELRDDYRTRPYPYGEVARDLTRILEGHNDE